MEIETYKLPFHNLCTDLTGRKEDNSTTCQRILNRNYTHLQNSPLSQNTASIYGNPVTYVSLFW